MSKTVDRLSAAMFDWSLIALNAYKGVEVEPGVLEEAANEFEEALIDECSKPSKKKSKSNDGHRRNRRKR